VVLLSNVAFASDAPLSASELLHQFWNHDPKAAALAGKPVRLSGLVAAKPGARLALQTDERGYFIRCTNDVANLPPPSALVVIEAKAPRERDSQIDVDECLVTWTEAEAFERIPADVNVASHVARSALLCGRMDPRLNRIPEGEWWSEVGLYPTTRRALESYFVSRQLEPIPCGNEFLVMLEQCRMERSPWAGAGRLTERDLIFEAPPAAGPGKGRTCSMPLIVEALQVAPMGDTSTQHDRRSWEDQFTRRRTRNP
jgi:hypothetical protein